MAVHSIELMPNLIMAHINCGIVYGKNLADFDAAIACFNEALDWEPNNEMAYCNRGGAYAGKGDFENAIKDLNKARELEPESAGVYLNRGNVYNIKGEINLAIADYTKAIELNPSFAEAYYNRGGVYSKKGDFENAIKDLNKAIQLKPDYAVVIAAWFHNTFGSVANFEQKTGIQLPADITALLSPPQA